MLSHLIYWSELAIMRGLLELINSFARDHKNDITLFKSVGTALEDLAAAELVIEKNL